MNGCRSTAVLEDNQKVPVEKEIPLPDARIHPHWIKLCLCFYQQLWSKRDKHVNIPDLVYKSYVTHSNMGYKARLCEFETNNTMDD